MSVCVRYVLSVDPATALRTADVLCRFCLSLPVLLPGAAEWNMRPDESGLPEVLNVAWAGHEIVSDTTGEMLDWFEKQPRT